MIMLLLTRSLVAALVIVGTAASTIAAAFGLSVLIWQDLVGCGSTGSWRRWPSSSCWPSGLTTTCF